MCRGDPVLDADGKAIPAYICAYRKPCDYYVLLNKEGRVRKSVFEDERRELYANEEAGETIEERHYEGCPHWNRADPFEL